jgi:hypothetical protein
LPALQEPRQLREGPPRVAKRVSRPGFVSATLSQPRQAHLRLDQRRVETSGDAERLLGVVQTI